MAILLESGLVSESESESVVLKTQESESVYCKCVESESELESLVQFTDSTALDMTALSSIVNPTRSFVKFTIAKSLQETAKARVSIGTPPQRFYTAYRGTSPTVAKMRYRIHNAEIREFRETASKDQFLTFHPSEGWGSLCDFLGKPVPDEDFPYKNKGGSVLDDLLKDSPIFHQMKYKMGVLLAILVILVAVLLFRWLY